MSQDSFKNKHIIVDELIKKSSTEKTEKIYITEDDGSRKGPFLRKVFTQGYGLGIAYQRMFNEKRVVEHCKYLSNIYDVFVDGDCLEVYEEYIEGETLNKYIANKSFNLNVVKDIYINLCEAVKYLHNNFAEPIIHKDIKPENILITKDGSLKLIDFGISRKYDKNKQNDTHKYGTLGYASPEHFGYQQTDSRSDIFSLGKVLEFLVDPSNWKDGETDISADFTDVIAKACQIDPKFRYQDISSLQRDFNIAFNGGNFFQKLVRKKSVLVIGHVWNVVLTLLIVFLIVVSINTVMSPAESFIRTSLAQQVIYGICLVFFIWVPVWFIFLFKPSARMIYKKIPKLKFWQYIIFAMCSCTLVMLSAILGQIIR